MTDPAPSPLLISPLIRLPRVHFDFGAVRMIAPELELLGVRRPLLVTDPGLVRCGVFATVRAALPGEVRAEVFDTVPENPTAECVDRIVERYRAAGCDGIVAVGGGSVIDSSKAAAVVAAQGGRVADYMGRPERIGPHVAPLIVVPTTSGTGSEVSRGAGIHATASSRGQNVGGPSVVPKVAICDPELTLTLPAKLTAATGMDALSHALESYLSRAVHPIGDVIVLDAVRRACEWLPRAVADGSDREARWQMMLASMQAMLSAKGLGPAHALANTFGDQGLHHGTLVALALPVTLRRIEPWAGTRMQDLARVMTPDGSAHPAVAIERLNAAFGLPSNFRTYGYRLADAAEAAEDAHLSFFNRTSPWHPSRAEYLEMIGALFA